MKLNYHFFTLFLSAILLNVYSGHAQKEVNSITNKECNMRGGLHNFFSKTVSCKDTIKVAYFGGSITAQEGWRVYSLEWFKKYFPKASFKEINAAIGGTGSDFGVFRLKEHVLKYKPDLVFVEFAVNDAGAKTEKITRSMEGIIRQIWQDNPRTDICFVYTIKADFLENEQKGILPTSAQTMEKLADKYEIPTINFGFEVASQVLNNKLIFTAKAKEHDGIKVFSPDGVHPFLETGHVIYQSVLQRSLEMMYASRHKPVKHKLLKPLAPDYFSNTQMLELSEVKLSKNWEIVKINDQPAFAGFGKYIKQFGKATHSGETITLHFKGRAVGAYDIMGMDAGRVIVEIDGIVKDTISRFDAFCTYRRMNYFLIDHLENKEHTVVFRVLSVPFDKGAILKTRNEVMKNPEEYIQNNWFVGKILIEGELK